MSKLATILARRRSAQEAMADHINAADTLNRAGIRSEAIEAEHDRLRGRIARTTGEIVLELSQHGETAGNLVQAYLDAQSAMLAHAATLDMAEAAGLWSER